MSGARLGITRNRLLVLKIYSGLQSGPRVTLGGTECLVAIVWLALLVALLDAVLVKAFKLDPVLVILYRGAGSLLKSIIALIRNTEIKQARKSSSRPQEGEA